MRLRAKLTMKNLLILLILIFITKSLLSQNLEVVHNGDNPVKIETNRTYNYSTYHTINGIKGYLGLVRTPNDMEFGTTALNNNIGKTHLVTRGQRRLSVDESGNIGIGTIAPAYKLQVAGWTESDYLRINGNGDNSAWRLGVQGNAIVRGTNLFLINSNGSKTIKLTNVGTVNDIISDGADLNIAADGGKNINFFGYGRTGGVTIGSTQLPTGYRFSIDGKMASEEVLVQLSGSWPDYVFNEGHEYLSLNELEKFIASNKHLPGIPKAEILEEEGVMIGEMQKMQMEKIEELTLYIIELKNEIEILKNKVNNILK